MTRFILEGTWTGYTSSQSRVCHREIISKVRAQKLKSLHKIVFTDGTALLIHIREAIHREHIKSVNLSYGSLIRMAEAKGGSVVLVSELAA
jgi:hypothetical protein